MTTTGRVILASNRLPKTVKLERRAIRLQRSAGGLATGLLGAHEAPNSVDVWIGWPGDVSAFSDAQRAEMESVLRDARLIPIHLSQGEQKRFYEGYSNGLLWPLFHYLIDQVPLESRDWDAYRRVNQRFADAIVANHRPGDMIWIHDFQLLLAPAMVRARIPDAKIGFFLHIPFPAYEVFRLLAKRVELLRGMLGADLIGFHTLPYLHHFASSVERILGVRVNVDRVSHEGRDVRIGVFPMGVAAAHIEDVARSAKVDEDVDQLRKSAPNSKLVVGVDRLDYTKGIPRRLMAIDRLLEREPALRDKLRFIQIAVPSRTEVAAYETLRREVDELVGRINGRYATATSVPIHYMFRSLNEAQVIALYRAADVMLVTPLRDGMNLVAKEFVASRFDEDGVLVLSELAGAASELVDAVTTNPYDVSDVASAIKTALNMPRDERRRRMQTMRSRVFSYDIHRWHSEFSNSLALTNDREAAVTAVREEVSDALVARIVSAPTLALFLDYDGTLVTFSPTPEEAAPDESLTRLLQNVAECPNTSVDVVSGRARQELDRWFRELPIGLHGEHGLWSRPRGAVDWSAIKGLDSEWKAPIGRILEQFVHQTPGSFVEEKSAGLAWHYRLVARELAIVQARELRLHLIEMLHGTPVEVLDGHKVIEIRMQGVHKGLIVARALAAYTELPLVVAMGDDRTDADLFAAVPNGGICVGVGPLQLVDASYHLDGPANVRALLERILAARGKGERSGPITPAPTAALRTAPGRDSVPDVRSNDT